MKANAKTDLRSSMEAKLPTLKKIAAELEKLPEAKAAAAAARDEQSAWLDNQRRTGNTTDRDKSIELSAEANRTAGIARNIESAGEAAQREIQRIERLLGAPAELERLQKESNAIASEGATVEKRALALRGVVDAIGAQRIQAAQKATAELADAAEAGVAARLAGKPLPPTKASGSANAELTSLDAELASAQRQLTATNETLRALGQRASNVRKQLLQARSQVAELDCLQALEDIRPIVEYRAAINRVAGLGHLAADAEIPLDEVAVQAMANELEAEHRGWQPTALSAGKTASADAGANESAEPGARAAA